MLNYEQMNVCEKNNYLKIISQDLDRLEKELKQTKLNFKNSQTHSKNCYKKLKAKYEKLEKENKLLKDINEINKNIEVKSFELIKENIKCKRALDILKNKIEFEDLGEMQSGNVYRGYFNDCLDEEEYEQVKEVLSNES